MENSDIMISANVGIAIIFLLASATVLVAPYVCYFLFIARSLSDTKRTRRYVNCFDYVPEISLIIPVYNEEAMIADKIRDLLMLDYPKNKLEIIILDDGSEDKTLEIAKFYESDKVKVIEGKENRGLSAAINAALAHARGEIIAKTDADIRVKHDILRVSAPYFKDPSVGAIMTNQILENPTENLSTHIEKSLQDYYHLIRKGESSIDSVIIGTGEFMLFRKGLVEGLREDENDDVQLAINIRRKGHRVIFLEDACYYEYTPTGFRDRWNQKVRRASQVVQVLVRNHDLFLNSDYGVYGKIIFPAEFLMHVVSPCAFALTLLLVSIIIVMDLWLALALVIVMSAICFSVALCLNHYTGKIASEGRRPSFYRTIISFIQAQIFLLVGSLMLLNSKPYRWRKVQSTRRWVRSDNKHPNLATNC